MVNESVKNAYVKKLINLSPYFSPFMKTFLTVLLIKTATRCYRFDDSDDDNACKDESMESLMKFLKDTILRIRAKLQFSSS